VPECLSCGRTFEASRRDASYCSDACRQQAYRDRRRASRNVTDDTEPTPDLRRLGAWSDVTRRWLRAHSGQVIASLKVQFRAGEGMSVE